MADATATPPSVSIRGLLRIPDFRRLYLAQAISDIGDGMTYLALFLLVLDLTGSTAAIALMSILVALPPVTVGLFAGAYADRHDRRRIMLVSDTLRAVVVLGMLLVAREEAIPALFALACLQAVVGTFFAPARMAMLPRVVPAEGLLAANSLSQATRMVASVIGGGITGVVAAVAGQVWPVLIVDASTFLISVVLILGVSRDGGPAERGRRRQREGDRHRRRGPRGAAGHRPLPGARRGARRDLGHDARPRRDQRPVHPVPRQRPRREPGVGRPARGGADDLDGPRRRRRGEPRAACPLPRLFVGGIAGVAVCVGPAGRRPRAVGAVPDHVRGRLVRDAGPGHDDDAGPAGHGRHDPRPRGRRPQRRDPDGLDRLDGRGRDPRGGHRDPRRCSPSARAVALLAAVVAAILFRGRDRQPASRRRPGRDPDGRPA